MPAKRETRVVKIIVDAKSANKETAKLHRQMERLNKSTRSITESIFRFQMGMQALASFLAVREIADLADKYTILHSRLKLVIKSQEDLKIVQKDLNTLASDVFTDVGSVAKAYTDLQLKVKGVSLTHKDAIKVVRTMAQSFRVSSSTAKEASSATLQLMQALSSGKLQGDELRTLKESNILLLNAIGEEYKRVKGLSKDAQLNLKELGAQGAITPTIIINALKKAAPEFEAQAAKLELTFSNIFVVATNKLAVFIGSLEAAGKLKGLKSTMLDLAKSADSLAVGFGSFVAAFASVKILKLIKNFRALNTVMLRNPILAIAAAVAILATYFFQLGKETTVVNGKVLKNLDLWMEMARLIKNDLATAFEKLFASLKKTFNVGLEEWGKIWEAIKPFANWLLNLPFIFLELIKALKNVLPKATQLISSFFLNTMEAARQAFSGNFLAAQDLLGAAGDMNEKLGAELEKSWNKALIGVVRTFGKDRVSQFSTLGSGLGSSFAKAFAGGVKELDKWWEGLKNKAAANLEGIKKKTDETLNNKDSKEKVRTFWDDARKGLQDYASSISDWSKQVSDLFVNTMKNFEDAMVKAVTTGKLEFKALADSIIADLARIMVRKNITGPLAQSLAKMLPTANAMGNAFVGGSVVPFAKGGVVNTPTFFPMRGGVGVMSEFGQSEAIMPLQRDRTGALGVSATGTAQTNVFIENYSGQNAQVNETVGADGTKNIRVTIGQVVKDGLANGQYDRVLNGAFGLRRKGTR